MGTTATIVGTQYGKQTIQAMRNFTICANSFVIFPRTMKLFGRNINYSYWDFCGLWDGYKLGMSPRPNSEFPLAFQHSMFRGDMFATAFLASLLYTSFNSTEANSDSEPVGIVKVGWDL